MGGAEIFLILSLLVNGWQFFDRGEIGAERDQLAAIAKNCKLEEQDGRKREFNTATETELVRSDIERVIAGSEQHIRAADQGGSISCRGELDRRSLSILDEARRRASEIDKLRMRSAGASDD